MHHGLLNLTAQAQYNPKNTWGIMSENVHFSDHLFYCLHLLDSFASNYLQ